MIQDGTDTYYPFQFGIPVVTKELLYQLSICVEK